VDDTAPSPAGAPRGLGEIIVSSRPYDEYRAMFGLTDAEILAGPVLDCPGGAGSFAAETRDRGGEVTSADPAYTVAPQRLVAESREGFQRGLRYLDENRDAYAWTYFDDVDDLRTRRGAALDRFAAEFDGPGLDHVVASLPRLPFADGAFRLVLSGYLLFTYPDHLDEDAHERALRELVRVARDEVRVYPLIDTAYARHPALDALRTRLAVDGVQSEVRRIGYAFQRGADEVLVLAPERR